MGRGAIPNIAYKKVFWAYISYSIKEIVCVIVVERILRSETVDYILTICIVWLIMIGFFLVLTREVLLLIGVAFPVLIIILLKNSNGKNNLKVH
jgi:diacylglycerol kinase